jgi:hypothetical protein
MFGTKKTVGDSQSYSFQGRIIHHGSFYFLGKGARHHFFDEIKVKHHLSPW